MNKKYFHINFVDVAIILLTLTVCAILITVFASDLYISNDVIQITMSVEEIPISHSGLIINGDDMYISGNDKVFGTVKSAIYSKSYITEKNEDGKENVRFYPDLHDIVITVECKADIKDNKFIINGQEYKEGEEIDFHLSNYAAKGNITKIEVIK